MKIEISSGALRLERGQIVKLRDAVGSTIGAREGTVWITEENNRRDIVLEPGACFRIGHPGLTLVHAFADASLTLN